MLPAGCFRLRVIADLGDDDSTLCSLGLQCTSITGALFALAEFLALRTDNGNILGEQLAAELVQVFCPMAVVPRLLPVATSWEADGVLRVRIAQEPHVEFGEIDAVHLEFRVHSRRVFPEAGQGAPVWPGSVGRTESAEIEEAIRTAALIDEWNGVCQLDGFRGKPESLFELLQAHFKGPATLAKSELFLATAWHAEEALLCLYTTHDARETLERVRIALNRIFEAEHRHQREANTRNRLRDLQ